MEAKIISALKLVADKYGVDFAKVIEQLFRNETRHFKSGNFIHTFSAGMEATREHQPYGWLSVKDFWEENKEYAPIGIYQQKENNSVMLQSRGQRWFIKFPSVEASVMTVAFIINSRGGDGGSWFSVNDLVLRKKYSHELTKIIPRFVNKFYVPKK